MALGILNGRVLAIEKAGYDLNPRSVVHYMRPDGEQLKYTLSTPLNRNLDVYVGKYLQVEISMISGRISIQESFTKEPV